MWCANRRDHKILAYAQQPYPKQPASHNNKSSVPNKSVIADDAPAKDTGFSSHTGPESCIAQQNGDCVVQYPDITAEFPDIYSGHSKIRHLYEFLPFLQRSCNEDTSPELLVRLPPLSPQHIADALMPLIEQAQDVAVSACGGRL